MAAAHGEVVGRESLCQLVVVVVVTHDIERVDVGVERLHTEVDADKRG